VTSAVVNYRPPQTFEVITGMTEEEQAIIRERNGGINPEDELKFVIKKAVDEAIMPDIQSGRIRSADTIIIKVPIISAETNEVATELEYPMTSAQAKRIHNGQMEIQVSRG
jgi:hypothetical protein